MITRVVLTDSTKKVKLKCVLLHNSNRNASLPTGHSTKIR